MKGCPGPSEGGPSEGGPSISPLLHGAHLKTASWAASDTDDVVYQAQMSS